MRLCCHFNFRTFALLIVGLCFFQLSQSEPAARQPEYDSVSIGNKRLRSGCLAFAPHVSLEAKTPAHHKSIEIEKFFTALSQLASEGRTDNASEFHEPTIYIDAVFQGKRVRLFFSGDSKLDKFNRYEKQWKLLHGEIFQFLNPKISPDALKRGQSTK